MPDYRKDTAKQILDDVRHLYDIISNTFRNKGIPKEIQNELDDCINRITANTDRLHEITSDSEWDNRTSRKFQKLNALLLVIPTIIGLVMLVWGITKISDSKKADRKQNQEIIKKDSLIKAQSDQNLNLNKTYLYELYGKSDIINLKATQADLLILTNPQTRYLTISVAKPTTVKLNDILYKSDDELIAAGAQISGNRVLIISVRKLKEIDQDITIQVQEPLSGKQFQLLDLLIK